MGSPDLNESAFGHASRSSSEAYRSASFQILAAVVAVLGGATAVLITEWQECSLVTTFAVTIIVGVGSLALSFVAVFAARYVAAPYAQRNELRANWPVAEIAPPMNLELEVRKRIHVGEGLKGRMRGMYSNSDADRAREWSDDVAEFLKENAPEHAREFMESSTGDAGINAAVTAQIESLRKIADAVAQTTA